MANIHEAIRSVNAYRYTGERSNSIVDFARTLKQTVHEDITQADQATGATASNRLKTKAMIYAQRGVEIGYIFTEVFIKDEYRNWHTESDSPRIIDLGGDPGAMTAIYWKHRAPHAQVTVVEANPATANVMQKTLLRKGLADVEVINSAVSSSGEGNAVLFLHKPRRGFHTQDYVREGIKENDKYGIEVPRIKLSSLVKPDEVVDLLKVDIEGSELEVMRELRDSGKMAQVKRLIMEFHHDPTLFPENDLIEMLSILQSGGFVIDKAHVTGKGMRGKSSIEIDKIHGISLSTQKIFLTLSAVRSLNP